MRDEGMSIGEITKDVRDYDRSPAIRPFRTSFTTSPFSSFFLQAFVIPSTRIRQAFDTHLVISLRS